MKRYRVEVSAQAEADVKEAYAYIKEHGPADPEKWKAGLLNTFASLQRFPERCAAAPEDAHTDVEILQKLYGPFRILFTLHDRVVYVLTVRHGARSFLTDNDLE